RNLEKKTQKFPSCNDIADTHLSNFLITAYIIQGGISNDPIQNSGGGHGLLHVRGSYQRCGAEGISREEGHLIPEQEGDHSAHGNGTGRGCPACGYFRYRVWGGVVPEGAVGEEGVVWAVRS